MHRSVMEVNEYIQHLESRIQSLENARTMNTEQETICESENIKLLEKNSALHEDLSRQRLRGNYLSDQLTATSRSLAAAQTKCDTLERELAGVYAACSESVKDIYVLLGHTNDVQIIKLGINTILRELKNKIVKL